LRPFPKSLGRLGDQIVVNAVFHNKGKSTKVRALLDTGAEVTALSMSRAKKIGVRFGGPVILRGAGGRATVRMGRIESVSIPGTGCEVGPLDVILFDQRAFPLGGLTGLQSIIGFDFMKKAKMQIAAFKRTRVAKCQI
jgi:predicted aspartyl protease